MPPSLTFVTKYKQEKAHKTVRNTELHFVYI